MDSTFQDLSFSSYLKPQNPTQTPQENGNCYSTTNGTELSVFDAHKYFNETNDPKDIKAQKQQGLPIDLLSVPRLSSVSSVYGYGKDIQARSFDGRPTASSEASWNSQTGLLANPPGSIRVSLRNLPNKKGSALKKWFLATKSCCSGKKSVQVKEVIATKSEFRKPLESINTENPKDSKCNYLYMKKDHSHNETAPEGNKPMAQKHIPLLPEATGEPRKQRISASGRPFLDGAMSFTFPTLSTSEPSNMPALIGTIANPIINHQKYSQSEIPPIVGPPSTDDRANPRGSFNLGSTSAADDDAASDVSSDLFEIENFSTQTAYPMHRRKDALGEDPPTAKRFDSANVIDRIEYEAMSLNEVMEATYHCAPREVSIGWRIATADGGDRANVAAFSISGSEIGYSALLKQRREESSGGGSDGKRKGNGLMLNGCRKEKAVSMMAQPVKCPARGNKPPPMGRCH